MEPTITYRSSPDTSKAAHPELAAFRAEAFLTANAKFELLGSTAGKEVRKAIDASGEPPVSQLRGWYDNDDVEPSSSQEFWDLCDRRDRYRTLYNKYWASTREKNILKRQVDGVIMPVAPTAAVEEGTFTYYSRSIRCKVNVESSAKEIIQTILAL